MSKQDEGLRVLKAEIKNFKNIDYRLVEAEGRSMIIVGKNEAGKSSLIQAIMSPFDAKFTPLEPIKEGEERGSVEITIGGKVDGEPRKYKISTFFTHGKKRGRLTIEDGQGEKLKGAEKTTLESIIGDVSFDIMKFVDLSVTDNGKQSAGGIKKQVEMIKSIFPREVLEKLYALDHERQEKYDLRTDVNREVKFYKEQIEKSEFSQEEIEKYSEEKSVESIQEAIKKANKFNEAHEMVLTYVSNYGNRKTELEEEIEHLKQKILEAEKDLLALNTKKEEVDTFLKKHPYPKDVSALEAELTNLSSFNTKVAKVKELDATKQTLQEKEQESQSYTDRINEIDSEKKEIFAGANMPVKGLAFDDEGVTYNGLPLCETNIPTSKLIGIGARIGMALNPNLRLLVVKRGESLDKDRMNALLSICSKEGYQLLIEKVDWEKDNLEVEFVEK